VILGLASNVGIADDWPTYRFNSARGAVTAETVGPQLYLHGRFIPAAAPKPAWPAPSEEMPRTHSDNAFHVAVANGYAYLGSSVTNKVHSVDATTGTVDWMFFAEGPVRFAPTVADEKVYFGSDDGYVYCVNAYDGSLVWKYRAGPSDEKVVGNGRLISIWPVRTSVLVDEGQVFFGAGVFPFEGIYICALDAKDGSVIWKNDTIGDRPHDLEWGGVSPQGYLVASGDVLYVPSGRSVPAAFDRKSGKFIFYASPGGKRGGTWAMLDAVKSELITGVDSSGTPQKYTYDAGTGARRGYAFGWFPGIDLVLTERFAYVLSRKGIYGIDRAEYSEAVRKATRSQAKRKELGKRLEELKEKLKGADGQARRELNELIDEIASTVRDLSAEEGRLRESSFKWRYSRNDLCSLIMAGEILYAGGEGLTVGVDAKTGEEVWKADVSGKAVGLAASDGRLFVSTDKGPIYCFGAEYISAPIDIRPRVDSPPHLNDRDGKIYTSAAEKIIKDSSVSKGYCLVVGWGTGRLAYELATRTDLKIVGIEKDQQKLKIARARFEAAGLLGSRVVVEPWDVKDLPPYFANLIVSGGLPASGRTNVGRGGLRRVLRPYGGVMMTGRATDTGDLRWRKFVRGKLDGAAGWTQLYANGQNTACSPDELVKGPFGLLWYGDPGPQRMVERHARAESPVSINGRLFVQGEEVVMAYDAYNGSFLWEREIPGAVRARVDVDGGNLALTEDALYIAAHEQCLRLDPATGKTVRTYRLPAATDGSPRRWGYVTCVGNVLLGTAAMPLQRQYAAIWKDFIEGDRWKEPGEMSAEIRQRWGGDKDYMDRYQAFKSTYPVPDENLRRSLQRSGAFWHPIADFPSWSSQRSPRRTLTNRLMGGDMVFAADVNTGKHLWIHRGKRIPNISVCTADGVVYFVESETTEDERAAALEEKRTLIERGLYEQGGEAMLKPAEADVRIVVALEAATGKVLWKEPLELTGCGGDKMGTAWADGVLLFFGHFSNHDTGFFKKGKLTWRRITAVDTETAEVIWSRPLNYLRRPLIVGDKVIIEPRACELRTGKLVTREHPITGEDVTWEFLRPGHCCSVTSASASTLFYRSYWAAIYDFANDKGLSLFGAIRPGCWLNMIAANGLMLMPEASAGCTCSFPVRCSVALVNKPKKVADNWTVLITHGATTPVKHLAVNFGAPGDMKADDGTMWFGYPRPKTVSNIGYGSYEIKLDLKAKTIDGMGPFCSDYRGVRIRGTDKPWLFTSGYRGLIRCELPLIDDSAGQKPASYTVRAGFKPLAKDKPGRRVFDVKLQGTVVLSKFDLSKAARKSNKAVVRQFKGIEVKNSLILELVPESTDPRANQAPVINFIEVVREEP
jgi:outer membrane protein assembly factor BamB